MKRESVERHVVATNVVQADLLARESVARSYAQQIAGVESDLLERLFYVDMVEPQS